MAFPATSTADEPRIPAKDPWASIIEAAIREDQQHPEWASLDHLAIRELPYPLGDPDGRDRFRFFEVDTTGWARNPLGKMDFVVASYHRLWRVGLAVPSGALYRWYGFRDSNWNEMFRDAKLTCSKPLYAELSAWGFTRVAYGRNATPVTNAMSIRHFAEDVGFEIVEEKRVVREVARWMRKNARRFKHIGSRVDGTSSTRGDHIVVLTVVAGGPAGGEGTRRVEVRRVVFRVEADCRPVITEDALISEIHFES